MCITNKVSFMKCIIKIGLVLLLVITLNSCNQLLKSVDNKKANSSEVLFKKLQSVNPKGIMFGHQDDLAYGVGWKYNEGDKISSDVEKVTGQFPAVLGWDIGKIGGPLNIDGVPFEHIKKLMIKGDSMGAINTVSWHLFLFNDSISAWNTKNRIVETLLPGGVNHQELVNQLDKVAAFFKELKNTKGDPIPIIFRPWHEMDGKWFWWGENYCTKEQFKELFVFTVDYLREKKGLNNLLIGYSPDRHFYSEEEYLRFYPGDAYVDVLGMDNYYDFKEGGDGIDAIVNKLNIIVDIASKKNKIPAFTETGSEKLENNKWFTEKLLKVLESSKLMSKLSYVLVWRNSEVNHFYVPYVGHASSEDFLNFTKNNQVLLLDDVNKILK